MKNILLIIVFGVTAFTISGNALPVSADTSTTLLTGAEEVPPVASSMIGFTTITTSGTDINYTLRIPNAHEVTAAHLHCGVRGQNGPVVAFLFGKGGGDSVSGELIASGSITSIESSASQCGPDINSLDDLIKAMQEGRIYINVHTKTYPTGEIRGQVAGIFHHSIIDHQMHMGADVFVEEIKQDVQKLKQELRDQRESILKEFIF